MASAAKNVLKALRLHLQKKYGAGVAAMPNDREVLVQLIYSALLENTPAAAALEAFEIIENSFIDWNELRVSSTSELVEMLPPLGDSRKSCERVRQTLQSIFQTTYRFDLEEWREKGETAFREYLESIPFTTRFMVDYSVRTLFQGNVFPLDEGAMRVFRLLDLVDIDAENHEKVKGLEKAVSKDDISLFAMQLHELGALLVSPDPAPALELLKEIDPASAERSYIPLVDVEEEDPRQIARRLANQRQRSMKMTFSDADDLDSEDDDFIENSESLEEQVPFDGSGFGEDGESDYGNNESASVKKDSAKGKEKSGKESKSVKVKEPKSVKELKDQTELKNASAKVSASQKEVKKAKEEKPSLSKTELPKAQKSEKSPAKSAKEAETKPADKKTSEKKSEKKTAAKSAVKEKTLDSPMKQFMRSSASKQNGAGEKEDSKPAAKKAQSAKTAEKPAEKPVKGSKPKAADGAKADSVKKNISSSAKGAAKSKPGRPAENASASKKSAESSKKSRKKE